MKKDSDYFEGYEPQLIYIAKRLRDAKPLESILTDAGIDFGVEPDEYYGGVIFRRIRTGAFFYVRPGFREQAVAVMQQNGYKPEAEQTGTGETV
ncbi:MAG: hypothetical protein QOJ99_4326 [Bryobacterales bacterium]|jgi:hypothetical protein|nr:hypothetical protein [Bryobacterales bacterium]